MEINLVYIYIELAELSYICRMCNQFRFHLHGSDSQQRASEKTQARRVNHVVVSSAKVEVFVTFWPKHLARAGAGPLGAGESSIALGRPAYRWPT